MARLGIRKIHTAMAGLMLAAGGGAFFTVQDSPRALEVSEIQVPIPIVRSQAEDHGDTPIAPVAPSTAPVAVVSTQQAALSLKPALIVAPTLPTPSPAPLSPASPTPASALMRALHGLWKADKKVFIDHATGRVIKEEKMGSNLFYSSFDGEQRCENVGLVDEAPRCSGGYTPYTIDAKGAIWEGLELTFEVFQDGVLKANYGAGTPTREVHIYVKVSSQPVLEIEY